MRLPLPSTCLLAKQQHLLVRNLGSRAPAATITFRSSSLSAIHRGLRDSEKARPQGFHLDALEAAAGGGDRRGGGGKSKRPLTSRQRRDPDWKPPTFTIKKGKKDITDKGPKPKSRAMRFNDPTESFGKKSQVWQIKHGNLKGELDKLNQAAERPSGFNDKKRDFSDRRGRNDQGRSTGGRSFGGFDRKPRDGPSERGGRDFEKRERPSFGDRPSNGRFDRGSSRTGGFDRQPRSSNFSSNDRSSNGRFNRDSSRSGGFDRQSRDSAFSSEGRPSTGRFNRDSAKNEGSDRSMGRSAFSSEEGGDRFAGSERSDRPQFDRDDSAGFARRQSIRSDMPIRIHHTTAVSQFLYGRSVVESALHNSRRQLYRLYTYTGKDGQGLPRDNDNAGERHADSGAADKLLALARTRKVECVPVEGPRGLQLMDKMSGGRPHNGFVLEASPLPQRPVKGLGPESEDAENQGFHLELNHQSPEEAAVNGTSTFVAHRLPAGRHPLVLLLDGILDPGNLGAILRSAAFLGVNAVAITRDSSAGLTPVAIKASAGAADVMTLFSVHSSLTFLEESKKAGWMVYAAVPTPSRMRSNSHLTTDRVEEQDPLAEQPSILVIGSEGAGLNRPVRRVADHEVSIPSASGLLDTVDSLNASVATAILCQAFLKKQTKEVFRSQGFAEPKHDDEALF